MEPVTDNNLDETYKSLGLSKWRFNGQWVYTDQKVKDSFMNSYVLKTLPTSEGRDHILDCIKNNKTFLMSLDDRISVGMTEINVVETNLANRLVFTITDDVGSGKMTINKRSPRSYKVKYLDFTDPRIKWSKVFDRKNTVLWEYEYNLNGLFWFLTNRGQKIEMFPDFVPFPELNGVTNIMDTTPIVTGKHL